MLRFLRFDEARDTSSSSSFVPGATVGTLGWVAQRTFDGSFPGAKVPEDEPSTSADIPPVEAAACFCCWATAAAAARDLVPSVDDEHTVVASSSCWDPPPDDLLRTDVEEEDATCCFLGYDVFLRTTEAPPPGTAAAAAAAPRSPRRMVTSSSDGGTLELAALRLTHLLIAPWRPKREGAMVDALLCSVCVDGERGKLSDVLILMS
jgi:hypothetical protein